MKTQCLLFFRLWCIICLSQYCTLQAAFGHDNLFRIEYGNRQYTLRDGLPNMLLETIFQDQDGFLWIGTYKGFARFDGYTFTPFLSETAFNILHFDTDMNGNIRAYTYHDYFVVDANDSIRSVRFAPDSIFLNTYNTRNLPVGYLILENYDATHKYLKRWQNDSLVTVLEIPQLDQIGESKPLLDLENEKLYLPSPQGVNIYDIRSKQVKLIKNLETEIFVKHKTWGILGFGTDGIYKFTENEHEKLTSYQFAQDIQAIETSDGSIIIKDMHSIYRFRNGILETLVSKSGGVIVDLLCDREGNLWSASHAGLCNYFRFDFKNFHLDNDKVKSVVEDSYGNHWFGTFYGKLIRRQGENSVLVNYPANMMKSFSFGATEQNKILYLPRDNDVLMYDQNRFWWAGLPGLPSMADGYSRVVPYKENQLLVLTQRGVHLCNQDGQSLHFFQENYFKQPDLQDLMIDSKGRWIVSGSIGLSIVGDTVQLFQGKNTAFTISICEDKQGRIWSGSENRLNLLKSDSVVTVHRFANDFILGLSSINDNHLLIETIQGIYIMNLLQDFSSSKVQFLLYNHRNGLTAQEPLVNGMYRDHQGILWMPCVDCLVSFEPEKLIRQVTPPVLHFQNCEISTNNVIWEKANLDKPFSYKFHNIKFSFIGLKYSAIENVRYTYRLKGFQEEWSKPSSIRETNFNNLPPGDYVFEVYADAGTDDSRTGIQQIRFNIQPAFWQTAWFPVISILLLMLLTTGIALSIQRKKNCRLLEQLEAEKELNELRIKSIRLRSIPHFNANVLSAIEYYIMNFSKEEANRLLNIYSEFIGRTLREVDKASRSLEEELEYTELYLKLEKLRFVDKFDYNIDIAPEIAKDVQLPNMILHTYCENAIKHGFAGRSSGCLLQISAKQKGDSVEVKVEDNGVGRKAAEANKNIRSTKQGLSILNRQIEIYNRFNKKQIIQKIVDLYNNENPVGTRFIIEIPYGFIYK